MKRLHSLPFFCFLFAVSGFSGLIYESIWSHYLKLFLGHSAYAQTLVLIIFMGGMSLGAWIAGRKSPNIKNLIFTYAIVEGIVGIGGLFFHSAFTYVMDVSYSSVVAALPGGIAIEVYKWTMAALLILPQTMLLGATFPLMSGGIIRQFPGKPGKSLSLLYFTNSLGGAIGILASGFLLVPKTGLPATILTAGIMNITLSVIVGIMAKFQIIVPAKTEKTAKTTASKQISQKTLVTFLLIAALTGMASFLYEIGWIRMLSLVLGSSTHAFELMLSAFILGLAIGSYLISRKIDNIQHIVKTLGIVQLAMSALAIATLPLYNITFDMIRYAMKTLTETTEGYLFFNIVSHSLCMTVMLPATICAGMTLPLITFHLLKSGFGEAAIGKVYAANTVGAIVGIVAGVHFVMPMLGLKNVIFIGALVNLAIGIAFLKSTVSNTTWKLATACFSALLIFSGFKTAFNPVKMASGVYRYGDILPNKKIVYHKDGKTSSVDVYLDSVYNGIGISTNGKPDAFISHSDSPSEDEMTMVLLAAIPLSLHDNPVKTAAIGIGAGVTSQVLLADDRVQSVDVIEIEPAMVEGAIFFGARSSANFTDPRCKIHIEDAKTFFAGKKEKYDLIISEPSNPWMTGVSSLFSKEFYEMIAGHVNNDGLFVQWMHLYSMETELLASVVKALSLVFKDYVIYHTDDANILIIASNGKIPGIPGSAVFGNKKLAGEIARIGVAHPQDILLRKLGSRKNLDHFFNLYDVRANSDYFPVLDAGAVKARYMNSSVTELNMYALTAAPLVALMEGDPSPMMSYYSAFPQNHYKHAYRAHMARAIYEYFRQQVEPGYTAATLPDANTMKLIRSLRTIRHQCNLIELENGWFPFLFAMKDLTLPYLTVAEMEYIWSDIEKSPCFASLPDVPKVWLQLFRTLGRRDMKSAMQNISLLLPIESQANTPEYAYLTEMGLMACSVLNDKTTAADLLYHYAQTAYPSLKMLTLHSIATGN